jgi:threonine synthase
MVAEEVVATLSPSMDIQISSNLERLLYELLEGNGPATAELLAQFRASGRAHLTADQHQRLRDEFVGGSCDDRATLEVMADVYARQGLLIDPHTAVAVGVAERRREGDEVVVTLATADPAKFPDAVEQATGVRPALPTRLERVLAAPERCTRLPDDLATVEDFIDGIR